MESLNLTDYRALVFDCDGVILNSNKVKTEAFRKAAWSYGKKHADALVDYHVQRGGVSRYKKFSYFLSDIVGGPSSDQDLERLLENYASEVQAGLRSCEIANGLEELRKLTPHAKWFIVSGGAQVELRELFAEREIIDLFDGGIFGSPDTKDDIFAREMTSLSIQTPAMFIGDSKYDHIAAQNAGIDFVFVTRWTEFKAMTEYAQEHKIRCLEDVQALQSLIH